MVKRVAEFKDRLNEALSIRNIKPVELAEKLGVTEGTISQYRKGTTKAKSDRLYEIALILEVNPVWLMGVDVPMDEKERAKSIIQDYINNSSDARHTDTVEVISDADKLFLWKLHHVSQSTLDSINLLIEADLHKP